MTMNEVGSVNGDPLPEGRVAVFVIVLVSIEATPFPFVERAEMIMREACASSAD